MSGKLKREIRQTKPFRGTEEEVALALMRTADVVTAPVNEVLKSAGLSSSQYNILRILRGAEGKALSCGDISERMVRRDPDITRLLDRMESRGLVSRTRDAADRRVVRASITEKGMELLGRLDEPVLEANRSRVGHVAEDRLQTLLEILEEIRSGDVEA